VFARIGIKGGNQNGLIFIVAEKENDTGLFCQNLLIMEDRKMTKKTWSRVFVIVFMSGILFATNIYAAGSKEGKSQGSVQSNPNARTKKTGKDITIAWITPFPSVSDWQFCKKGVEDAARDCGITAIFAGPATQGDPIATVEVIQNYLAQGVDGIITIPSVESAFLTVARDAKRQGVPHIAFAGDYASDTSLRLAFIGTDNYWTGTAQIEGLHKLAGTDNLKVLVLMSDLGSSNQVIQVQAIKDYVDKLKAKGADAEVLDVREAGQGGGDDIRNYDTTANMLKAYPEANLFLCTFGAPLMSGKAVDEAGLRGKVLVSGYDEKPESIAALRSGSLTSLIVQNFYNWGYGPTRLMYEYLMGADLKENYDGGAVVVTMANVDTYKTELEKQAEWFK
jgi:ribose transport system substrate-binding protein